jgi:hypothetical protein
MEITKDTRVSEILREYGDIADVMEVFGIKRVARYSFRSFITKAITVERAAKIHRVPLDEFLITLRTAIGPQAMPSREPIGPTGPSPTG